MARSLLNVFFVALGFLYLVLSSPLVKRNFPNPEIMTGDFPNGHVHDPSIIRRHTDGKYFMFTTNDGVNIHTAASIQGPWTHVGNVMERSVLWTQELNDIWAPDVFRVGDTYYLYYAASGWGAQNSLIGVCTSTTMDPGSWTDHGDVGIPAGKSIDGHVPDWNAIDPNLFQHDPDSPFYLTFGSYWSAIHQYEMQNPPLKIIENVGVQWLETNNTPPRNSPQNPNNDDPTEGAYLFWYPHNGHDYHYLFFSSGYCCQKSVHPDEELKPAGQEYKIMVCRSDNPTFGFVDREGVDCLSHSGGTMILGSQGDIYSPGGQGVFFDDKLGEVIIYYHYVRRSLGYAYNSFQVGYNILDFDDDGWPTVRG